MRGSVVNRVQEKRKVQPEPKVGMGVTIYSYTDRAVGTIIEVSKSGKSFYFRYDRAVRTDKNGMSESQSYKFLQVEDGLLYKAFKTRSGIWKIQKDGRVVGVGFRNFYHDFSF